MGQMNFPTPLTSPSGDLSRVGAGPDRPHSQMHNSKVRWSSAFPLVWKSRCMSENAKASRVGNAGMQVIFEWAAHHSDQFRQSYYGHT